MAIQFDTAEKIPRASLDSQLVISLRAFLRALPFIFFDKDIYFWEFPERTGHDDIDESIEDIFHELKTGSLLGNDVAIFELFHSLQYVFSYIYRVENITKVNKGVVWDIFLQADNYNDFHPDTGNSNAAKILHAFNSLIEATVSVIVSYHGYNEVFERIKDQPPENLNSDISIDGCDAWARREVNGLLLTTKSYLSNAIELSYSGLCKHGFGEYYVSAYEDDLKYINEKHLRGYDKNTLFNNTYAIDLLHRKLNYADNSLFDNQVGKMCEYLESRNVNFDFWINWYGSLLKGCSFNPDNIKLLVDVPERFTAKEVDKKNIYIKRNFNYSVNINNVPKQQNVKKYHLAVSFAGEDRDYVHQFVESLSSSSLSVFYDEFEKSNLWGKNLYQYFNDVFKNQCEYCVIFISRSYIEKIWTRHELASAQARAISENREYILPVRFDDTEIPGIDDTIGYIDIKELSPSDLAAIVLKKIRA